MTSFRVLVDSLTCLLTIFNTDIVKAIIVIFLLHNNRIPKYQYHPSLLHSTVSHIYTYICMLLFHVCHFGVELLTQTDV